MSAGPAEPGGRTGDRKRVVILEGNEDLKISEKGQAQAEGQNPDAHRNLVEKTGNREGGEAFTRKIQQQYGRKDG